MPTIRPWVVDELVREAWSRRPRVRQWGDPANGSNFGAEVGR